MGDSRVYLKISLLQEDNFKIGKCRLLLLLDAQDLLEIASTLDAPTNESALAASRKLDKKAKHYIVSFVSDEHFSVVQDKRTAKEMFGQSVVLARNV